MKTRIIFILFFILLVSQISYSYHQFYDNFSTGTVVNNALFKDELGYAYIFGACVQEQTVYNRAYNGSFGYNDTNECVGSSSSYISKDLPSEFGRITTDFTLKYDFTAYKYSSGGFNDIYIQLLGLNSSSEYYFDIYHGVGADNITRVRTWLAGDNCSFQDPPPITANYELTYDFLNSRYSFSKDGIVKCDKFAGSQTPDINAILIGRGRGGSTNVEFAVDNINITDVSGGVSTPSQTCTYPIIFCDKFNYANPLMDQEEPYDWFIFDGFTVDDQLSPEDNILKLETGSKRPVHDVEQFTYSRPVKLSDSLVVTGGYNSPTFSTIMDINLSTGCLNYIAEDRTGHSVFDILGCSNNSHTDWYYLEKTGGYTSLTDGIELNNVNKFSTVQLIVEFSPYHPEFEGLFNTSHTADTVRLYIDNSSYGNFSFLDNDAFNYNAFNIVKNSSSVFYIDNYYVTVGTSKDVDTIYLDLIDFTPSNVTVVIGDEDDLRQNIMAVYSDLGLKTAGSRYLLGAFILFIITFVIIGGGIGMRIPVAGVVTGALIVDVFLMTILLWLELIPIWVIILLILLGGGATALAIALKLNSS